MGGADVENVVLIDMDNTIVDYDKEFAKRWAELRPGEDILPKLRSREHFEIERNFDEGSQDVVKKIMLSEDFFIKLQEIEGAIAALKEMESLGLQILLCTSPSTFQYEASAANKYAWVRKYLGEDWMARLVVTRDKSVVKGCVLIDDKPSVKGASIDPVWSHIVFEQPYNLEVTDKPRMTSWSQWKDILAPYFPKFLS